MTITEIREKYGDRVLSRAVSEIVIAGIETVKKRGNDGHSIDVVVAAVAEDIDASDWQDVRSIIKRTL